MLRRALILSLLVAALAACGGSSSSLTKAQYDAKVNRLCLLAADQLRELHMDNSIGAWQHSGSSVVRVDEHFDTALAALKAPSEIATGAAAFLKANEKVATDDKAALIAAMSDDRAGLRAAGNRSTKDSAATSPAVKAIGATGCYIS